MRKRTTIIGQAVYGRTDGTRLATVRDLIVDPDERSVTALLLDGATPEDEPLVLPLAHVHRFGPSAIMVEDATDAAPVSGDSADAVRTACAAWLLGRPVATADGDELGRITDVFFDDDSGELRGFEVAGGRLSRVLAGGSFLPVEALDEVNIGALVASETARDELHGMRGEIRARFRDASARLRRRSGPPPDPDALMVGRHARADVADRTGSILVARGQRIDGSHVRAARDASVVHLLYAAAGIDLGAAARGLDEATDATELEPEADTTASRGGRSTDHLRADGSSAPADH